MPIPRGSNPVARAVAVAGAGTAAGIALFALAAWLAGNLRVIGAGGGDVPIAPGTAFLLLLLAAALVLVRLLGRYRGAQVAGCALAWLVVLLCADAGARGFAGLESSWEQALLPAPVRLHGIAIGRMSPFTAALLLFSGLPLATGVGRLADRKWIRLAGGLGAGLSAFAALGIILGYAAGASPFYASGLTPVALLTAVGVVSLDAGLLAGSVSLWLTDQRPAGSPPPAAAESRVGWRREIAFSAAAALVVLASGVIYLRVQLAAMRNTAARELAAIGDLKAEAILAWRAERMHDAQFPAQEPAVARSLAALLAGSGGDAAARELTGLLEPLRQSHAYAGIVILDDRGAPRLALPATFQADAEMLRAAHQALASRAVVFADLHDGAGGRPVSLDLVTPVEVAADGPGAAPIGVIAIRVDAGAELFRLLGSWPIPSETAETLLVRREGDEVVFLNELRHRAGTALRLRFPIGDPDLPAAAAVRGATGVREGVDYRGVRVLAAVRQVPGTPWSLVAKIDQQEIYAPLRRQATAVAAIVLALLLATGFWSEIVWRRKVAALLGEELDTERRYRELAERFGLITRYGSDVIVVADETGRIVEANERAVETYRYTHDELLALTQRDLRAPDAQTALAGDMDAVAATGSRLFETIHRRKDGTTFPAEVNYRQVQIGGQDFRLEFIRDITKRKQDEEERRRFESQIQRTQRLESLGVMAGGIAHDFNNLLTTILGRAGLMRLQLPADTEAGESLKEIEKASERAAGLCRQMLAYAGKNQIALEAIDLSRVVEEMGTLLQIAAPAPIVFRRRLDPNLPPIESDAAQVRQVVVNLVTNAAEAMREGGGTIDLATGVMDCDEAYLSQGSPIVPPPPGRYVYLEVSDTGAGMDAAVQAKIFDPFFSTKFPGRGLGLAAVLGIVLNNHGSLKFKSEPRQGSTFRVLFPVKPGG